MRRIREAGARRVLEHHTHRHRRERHRLEAILSHLAERRPRRRLDARTLAYPRETARSRTRNRGHLGDTTGRAMPARGNTPHGSS
jgi:hypothetical protein